MMAGYLEEQHSPQSGRVRANSCRTRRHDLDAVDIDEMLRVTPNIGPPKTFAEADNYDVKIAKVHDRYTFSSDEPTPHDSGQNRAFAPGAPLHKYTAEPLVCPPRPRLPTVRELLITARSPAVLVGAIAARRRAEVGDLSEDTRMAVG